MPNLRDKILKLAGKQVFIELCDDEASYYIRKVDASDRWYEKIVEFGDDYFDTERVFKGGGSTNIVTTYAISKIISIDGRSEEYKKL